MLIRLLRSAALAIVLTSPVAAGSPELDPVELAADPKPHLGYRWQVPCSVMVGSLCATFNPSGQVVGRIMFDLDSLEKQDRVRILTDCMGGANRRECWAWLTGDLYYDDNVAILRMKDPKIIWQK